MGLTYLRGNRDRDRAAAEGRAAVLNEMFEWVRGLVEDGTGPKVIRMFATADIEAGQLLGKADLALKQQRSDRSDPNARRRQNTCVLEGMRVFPPPVGRAIW